MAVDMFLEMTPDVPGESRDKKYEKKIDVLAWSWGMSNSGTTHMGGGGGAGKVNMQDLSVTKYVDRASATLQLACAKGTHYDTVTLTCRKAGGTAVEYIKIVMSEVIITSLSTGGSGGEDRLTENVTFNFGKVKYTYQEQDSKGAAVGKPAEYTYSIAENADS